MVLCKSNCCFDQMWTKTYNRQNAFDHVSCKNPNVVGNLIILISLVHYLSYNACFPRLVGRLFFALDYPHQDPIIAVAKDFTNNFLYPIMHDYSQKPAPPVQGLVNPYHVTPRMTILSPIESALSRIVIALMRKLNLAQSKYDIVSIYMLSFFHKIIHYRYQDTKISLVLTKWVWLQNRWKFWIYPSERHIGFLIWCYLSSTVQRMRDY